MSAELLGEFALIFVALALACSLLVLKAKPPTRLKPLPAGSYA